MFYMYLQKLTANPLLKAYKGVLSFSTSEIAIILEATILNSHETLPHMDRNLESKKKKKKVYGSQWKREHAKVRQAYVAYVNHMMYISASSSAASFTALICLSLQQ